MRGPILAFIVMGLAACGGAATLSSPTPIATNTSTPTLTASPTVVPTATPSLSLSASPSPSPLPTAVPTKAPPLGPAAYCQVADAATPIGAYADYARTYLDWTYTLNKDYVPPDLVSTADGGPAVSTFGVEAVGAAEVLARRGDPAYSTLLADAANASIRRPAYADFVALRAAATAAGVRLVVLSAYRSFNLQVQTFNYWVSVGGYEQALRTSARPGHSEHQLGTAIDFGDGSAAPWEYADWATTASGAWLAAHAADYGWVLSFPKGKTDVTCYDYEPWHYRYVGKDIAHAVSESRVTLREYQSTQLR